MTKEQHWSVEELRKIRNSLGRYAAPAYEAIQDGAGELEGFDLYFVEVAILLGPDPIGVAHIYKRAPYANPDGHRARMESTVGRGWLEKSGESGYIASEKGKDLYMKYLEAYKAEYGDIKSLSSEELDRVVALLGKVVVAAEKYEKILDKPALQLSLNEIVDEDAPALQVILTQAVQMLAFRDDAHVASWSAYKIDGITWEAFSDIWGGEVSTTKELVEKRPGRQYSEEEYTKALGELVTKSWVANKDDSYEITEEGRRVREEAEDITNEYYDGPWGNALNSDEAKELQGLMEKLIAVHEPESQPA